MPPPGAGQVLIRVAAAGVNDTDINTRVGWYSKSVTTATDAATPIASEEAGSWSGAGLDFPRIQGADACGHVVGVGEGVDPGRVGQRVLVATLLGATYQEPSVLADLIGYIERDEIRPLIHATYPLEEIVAAQKAFLASGFVGKLVLVPPPVETA